jgi:hypothetical protein
MEKEELKKLLNLTTVQSIFDAHTLFIGESNEVQRIIKDWYITGSIYNKETFGIMVKYKYFDQILTRFIGIDLDKIENEITAIRIRKIQENE